MVAPDARETPHKYITVQQFRTLNSQPSRTALEQDEFSWIENLMPIGDAFAPIVPGPAIFASLNPAVATVISAASPGTETWIGAPADVGTVTETFGIIFGPYLGVLDMYNNNDPVDTNVSWSEVSFYIDAVRQNEGLTCVISGSFDVGTAAYITDEDFDTYAFVGSSGAAHTNNRFYLGFDFGAALPSMNGIRFASWEVNTIIRTPYQTSIAQSVDGLNWSYVANDIATTQPADQKMYGGLGTFAMEYPDAGQHIYWRIADIDNFSYTDGNRPLRVAGIAVYSGGADVTSSATKSTTMTFDTGSMADWFDGSVSTMPTVAFANIGTLTFEFASPIRINGLRFDANEGLSANVDYIHRCSLQYSNNGTDWTTAGRIAATTYPGDNTFGNVIRLY